MSSIFMSRMCVRQVRMAIRAVSSPCCSRTTCWAQALSALDACDRVLGGGHSTTADRTRRDAESKLARFRSAPTRVWLQNAPACSRSDRPDHQLVHRTDVNLPLVQRGGCGAQRGCQLCIGLPAAVLPTRWSRRLDLPDRLRVGCRRARDRGRGRRSCPGAGVAKGRCRRPDQTQHQDARECAREERWNRPPAGPFRVLLRRCPPGLAHRPFLLAAAGGRDGGLRIAHPARARWVAHRSTVQRVGPPGYPKRGDLSYDCWPVHGESRASTVGGSVAAPPCRIPSSWRLP